MKHLSALLAAAITCAAAAPALATDRWIDRANAKYEYLYWKPAWAYHPIRGYDGCKDGLLIRKQRCRDNYFKHYKRPHHATAVYGSLK